ncbi:NADH-quinone oxidoreductase subunit B family protein [Lacibacterium aquatile]|uniref:NADH-quinone oxidoreductase subunit B family protein n=1 Tax=Lacibacterium aquatile TaxID=1168082 RepID=A0ABW5DPJ2_9PROT
MRRILLKNIISKTRFEPPPLPSGDGPAVEGLIRRSFGRSLAIRHVDAGSCNACELELQALSNPYYDLERFGISFTASPRHADVLLVTGIVTWTMADALRETYEAMPGPKWVIASGNCAINGSFFADSPVCAGAVGTILPVDLTIPGCPPTPRAVLAGLFGLLEKS